MHPYSHDRDFILESARRQRERQHSHRNDRVRHVCELVQTYRGFHCLENDEQFALVAGVPLRTVQHITAMSLDFNELTVQLVEKLARAIQLPAHIIVGSGQFTLGDLLDKPEEKIVSGRQRRQRNGKKRRRDKPVRIDRRRNA